MTKSFRPLVLAVCLASCAPSPPVANLSDPACGWNANTRQMARDTFLYAQLANNAYPTSTHQPFAFGPEVRLIDQGDNPRTGFAYSIYERQRPDRKPERIIAFRGTQGVFGKDMWHGNVLPRQNAEGVKLYEQWRSRSDGFDLNVTGHSLGGAIATQVSLCFENVETYVFNTSSRFSRCKPVNHADNRRISVAEYGELLKIVRLFGRSPNQQYNSIGCVNRANPAKQHGIRLLAECLTRVAAADSDRDAARSLDANPSIPRDCWPRGGRWGRRSA